MSWYSPEANRGYTAHGREKVTQLVDKDAVEALRAAVPDLKESLEIGRDDEEVSFFYLVKRAGTFAN